MEGIGEEDGPQREEEAANERWELGVDFIRSYPQWQVSPCNHLSQVCPQSAQLWQNCSLGLSFSRSKQTVICM